MSEQYNQNAHTKSMSTHVSLRHGHIDTDNLASHAHVILPIQPHCISAFQDINRIKDAVTSTHTGRRDTKAGVRSRQRRIHSSTNSVHCWGQQLLLERTLCIYIYIYVHNMKPYDGRKMKTIQGRMCRRLSKIDKPFFCPERRQLVDIPINHMSK